MRFYVPEMQGGTVAAHSVSNPIGVETAIRLLKIMDDPATLGPGMAIAILTILCGASLLVDPADQGRSPAQKTEDCARAPDNRDISRMCVSPCFSYRKR